MSKTWQRILIGLATLVVALMVLAVLFPVFAKAPASPNGLVLAGFRSPLRNTQITVRANGLARTTRTDKDGRFRILEEEIGKATVDGYVLTRRGHRTGSSDLYTFGALGEATFSAVDEAGKPLKDVTFGISYPDYSHKNYFSRNGVLVLNKFPVCLFSGISAAPKGRYQSEVLGLHVTHPDGKLNYQVVFKGRQ